MSFGARGGFGGATGGRGCGQSGLGVDNRDSNFGGDRSNAEASDTFGGCRGGFAGSTRPSGGASPSHGFGDTIGERGGGFVGGQVGRGENQDNFGSAATGGHGGFGVGVGGRGRGGGFGRGQGGRGGLIANNRDNNFGGDRSNARTGDTLGGGGGRGGFPPPSQGFGGAAGGRGGGFSHRGFGADNRDNNFGGDRSNTGTVDTCGGGRGGFTGGGGRGGFTDDARPSGGSGGAFFLPPQGFGDDPAAGGGGGFGRGGDDFGRNEFRDDARPQPNNYIPEVRPVEDLYQEDTANAENYRQVTDDDDEIHVSGPNIDVNVRLDTWNDAGFPDIMLKNIIERSMYIRPRKIQAQVIPFVMTGRDVKGHAETGSGKTAAFMLPIIHKLMNPPFNASAEPLGPASPYAIIVEPTRELCSQVYEQGRKFAYETGVTVAKCYGQYNMRENLNEIRAGCNILCATTGRLKHFIMANLISTRNLMFFVLDEADTLLESNFLEDIREIVNSPNFPDRNSRQTMLFSATFPEVVQQLSADVLREDCVFVSNRKMVAANSRVIQCFELVGSMEKKDKLLQLLKSEIEHRTDQNPNAPPLCRTLVFVRTKRDADLLAIYLTQKGIKATTINGDRPQRLRELALNEFRNNLVHVLVSTDVCARGIDIKDLDHVINFDLPNDAVTYVHRIGRTGRLKHGRATSFFDEMDSNDLNIAKKLVEFVRDVGQEAPEYLLRAAGMSNGFACGDGGYSAATLHNQASSGW